MPFTSDTIVGKVYWANYDELTLLDINRLVEEGYELTFSNLNAEAQTALLENNDLKARISQLEAELEAERAGL